MEMQDKYSKPSGHPPMRFGSLMMRVAAVLLCLVMGSFYLMGGMFARYTINGSGNDSARVAKFDVKIIGLEAGLIVACGEDPESGTYTITVQNMSEVAVSYTISVEKSVAATSLTFDTNAVSAVLNSTGGTLAVGSEATHELTFTVSDWSKITTAMTGSSGEVSLDFTVTIDVVQVD